MRGELAILGLMWVIYCSIHSFLITERFKAFAKDFLKENFRYFRLFYNTLSIVLLIPIFAFSSTVEPIPLSRYSGWTRIFQLFLILSSLTLFYLGARAHDMGEFLGISQARGKSQPGGQGLTTSGVLGFVRHPWYLAGIMIIWGRDIDDRALVTNFVLTAYFVVGSCLEEMKLKREFGQKYLDYMDEVSMLLPLKWLKKRFIDGVP